MWDGKLGLWPLTEEYVAQRSSRNRPKGTVCTRNIDVVNRNIYKNFLIRYVIPAIKQQWPRGDRRRPVMIQQDNAKPHVLPHDADVVAAGMEAPNSPDLNVLDLGLFNAIQNIQYCVHIHGIDNIITAVQGAYKDMSTDTLDNIFLTLQDCMRCVLRQKGGNQYALPHIGKAKLRRKGILPSVLCCDQHLYDSAKAVLTESDRGSLASFEPAE
ncbi:hypothetical protein PC112_g5398 [Phytophthora cactorum]|nr:hypothetical protein PC112_g5398 [Phytophthora cactorum]